MKNTTISISDFSPSQNNLSGKTILITGCDEGLGRSLALDFAVHGATIILLGKSVTKLEALYDEIEQRGSPQPAIMPMDLEQAEEPAYEELADAIHDNFGQLDGLILNAVCLGQHSPIVHIDFEQWSRSLSINLTANFLFLKHCSGLLNQAGRASVIYVSDQLALHGKAYWGTYATSKAACVNLMQTVADEWESNTDIHLNCIDPGPMSTALRRQAFPGETPDIHPSPETLTKAFLYFMDPGKNWPNGKHLQWDSATQNLVEI